MFVYSSNGPRTVPDELVIHVSLERVPGRYCPVTVVLDDGREVCGLALKEALDALEAKLVDSLPPAA
jgi:hypothetical protein